MNYVYILLCSDEKTYKEPLKNVQEVTKEYAVLSKRILENKNRLEKLVGESIKYVLLLKGRKH